MSSDVTARSIDRIEFDHAVSLHTDRGTLVADEHLLDAPNIVSEHSEPVSNDRQLQLKFRFAHDRVQQAVYSLIPDLERQQIHYNIGHLLLQHSSFEQHQEKLFDLANHLNQAHRLIDEEQEKIELAALNLAAGRKAKLATAYEAAFDYIQTGLNLLPPKGWQTHYNLTINLYTEAVEVAYLNSYFEQSEQLSTLAINQVKTPLEKSQVYKNRIQAYVARSQMEAAIEAGFEILTILDVSFRDTPPSSLTVSDFDALPEMSDPSKQAAMEILVSLFAPIYISNPKLLPRLAFTMLDLCVAYGNPPVSGFVYSFYGLLLCSQLDDVEQGYLFGKLALTMLDRFETSDIQCRVNFLFNVTIRHWKEHTRETIEPLRQAIQIGLETGDLAYTGYAAPFYCSNPIFVGEPLEEVSQKQRPYLKLVENINQAHTLYGVQKWAQFVLNLRGLAVNKELLVGEFFDETEMLPLLQESNNLSMLYRLHLCKTILSYLFGDYETALTNARLTTHYEKGVEGLFVTTQLPFYYALILLARYPAVNAETQRESLKLVDNYQQKMAFWGKQAPMNFQHKYDLVEAEKARILGNAWHAAKLYERAIKGAKENNYLHEEALAYELTARFYLEQAMTDIAHLYLAKAHYGYTRWQANAKVKDLQTRYPHLQLQIDQGLHRTRPITTTTTGSNITTQLDLSSVLKASQALSSEVMLGKLLTELMDIVIENAGAQKGYLLLNKEDRWSIEASIDEQGNTTVLQSIPFPEVGQYQTPLLPVTLINYVIHTQESVLLNNATY
ncbi:MAG: hypothetical protein AAF485_23625, partial [Chloroflexota bacterium]